MSRRRDGWIGWTTTGCVALLAGWRVEPKTAAARIY